MLHLGRPTKRNFVPALRRVWTLTSLDVGRTNFGDLEIGELQGLPLGLEHLNLRRSTVTKHFILAPNLKTVDLVGCDLLWHLLISPGLECVHVHRDDRDRAARIFPCRVDCVEL